MLTNDKKNNSISASVEDLDYSGLPLNRAKLTAKEVDELTKELGLEDENLLNNDDNDIEEAEEQFLKTYNRIYGGF